MSLLANALQTLPIGHISQEAAARLRSALRKIPLIKADNVATYMFQHTDILQWVHLKEHFPNLAPPFAEFWIEYRQPRSMMQGGEDMPLNVGDWHIGVHFSSMPLRSSPEGGWKLFCLSMMAELTKAASCGMRIEITLNGQGQVQDHREDFLHWNNGQSDEHNALLGNFYWRLCLPAFLALSFCHCKNVLMKIQTPPAALAKRNLERGKPPMLKYHILQIEPMKKVLRQEGRIETEGLKRALHICRGHFAHYPETGPGLFGKGIHGDFWIPQHARGSTERGVVVSDFHVKAPSKEKES